MDFTNLAERLKEATGPDNYLDVLVEVALFTPDNIWREARANSAGTKVIYTDAKGGKTTAWARDWTAYPARTVAALRARAGAER